MKTRFNLKCLARLNTFLIFPSLLFVYALTVWGQSLESPRASKVRTKSTDAQLRLDKLRNLGMKPENTKYVTEQIIDLLKSESDVDLRAQAISTLGLFKADSKDAINQYVLALGDKNESVLSSAALAIGLIARTDAPNSQLHDAIQPLINALRKDHSIQARRESAQALGQIGVEAKWATPELIEALKDNDTELRQRAATALGLIRTDTNEAVTQLINILQNENEDVTLRDNAAQSDRKSVV